MEIRSLHPRELPAYWAAVSQGFRAGPREAGLWARLLESDPDYHPSNTRVCVVQGNIVSGAHTVAREMCVAGRPVPIGGVASVFTIPSHRRRGYVTALLADTCSWLRSRGLKLALLTTQIPEFYSRLGWQSIPRREEVWKLFPGPLPKHVPARLFEKTRDLSHVMRLYENICPKPTGFLTRTREFWKANLWYGEEPASFFVAHSPEGASAYVRGGQAGPRDFLTGRAFTIREAAFLDGQEHTVEHVLYRLANLCLMRRLEWLVCAVPATMLPRSALQKVAVAEQVRLNPDHMVRIIDWPGLLDCLKLDLMNRVAEAKAVGPISFSLTMGDGRIESLAPDQSVRISLDSGKLNLESGTAPLDLKPSRPRMELTPRQAAALIFGGWKEVAGDFDAVQAPYGVEAPIQQAMALLFPPQDFYHWSQGHY